MNNSSSNMRLLSGFIFFFIFTGLSITGCSTKGEDQTSLQRTPGVTLKGRINYPVERRFYIENLNNTASAFLPYDTVQLAEDNTFEHFVEVGSPGFYRLNFSDRQSINLILNEDDLEIIADGNNVAGYVDIKGSTELDNLRNLNTFIQQEYISKERDLNRKYTQARQAGDAVTATAVQNEYMTLVEQKELAIIEKIKDMGASLSVIQALNYIDKDEHFPFYQETVELLASRYPDEPNIQKLSAEVERLKVLAIGMPAPEIELPNPEGEIVKLSSLKGNVVLLDFWAEWCKPCRLENPNVVKAYKKYNDKGFEVFGVSLDKNREKWIKAIQEDGLHWTQVSDLKYWQSEAAKTYNVSAIPMSFLLDEEGIIIAKNLRGKALEDKLEELFSDEM